MVTASRSRYTDYLEYMNEILQLRNIDQKVVAVVPNINSENQMISPVFSDRIRPLTGDKPKQGIQLKPVMAINSGACPSQFLK